MVGTYLSTFTTSQLEKIFLADCRHHCPDEIKQLNWIISSFNLTSAAFLPFWAQIADVFGRHLALQAAIIIMLAGSAIYTGTSIFGVLLLGRALQGMGAAGVNIAIRTILADRVSLADYALNWTLFTLVSGFSFSCGPLIGGYLTRLSWRWCFAINLPVGIASILVVASLLRHELLGPQPLRDTEGHDMATRRGRFLARLSTVDYGGQTFFLWGLGLLILALTWGGGTYPWNSPAVLVPLVAGSILSVGWIFYERSMSPGSLMSCIFPNQTPMIPWELLSQRDILLLFYINFTTGMAAFAVMYFLDLYFVLVEGRSSSEASTSLLFYIPGVGGMFTMFLSNRDNPHCGKKRIADLVALCLQTCRSWWVDGHVFFQCLATPDAPSSSARERYHGCWYDGFAMGRAY